MPLIEWSDKFRIGIPSVDYEHQELIALLNALYEGLEAEPDRVAVGEFLGEVFARISAHFALEERVMRDQAYDGFASHKDDHEVLLDRIREIMDAFDDGQYADSLEAFGADLAAWFGDHFKTQDARLHEALGDGAMHLGSV